MASKFQKSIAEIRNKVALQGAETVARLHEIETRVSARFDELKASMQEGFEQAELALVAQTEQNVANFDALLEQVAALEQDQQTWRQQMEERVSRLEQGAA